MCGVDTRYKVTCPSTWPNPSVEDREASELMCKHHKIEQDVAYGKTKLFIRSPQTLTLLEQERTNRIPHVALVIQKVRGR